MNKLIYTTPQGTLAIIIPTDKSIIERDLNISLSDSEYENFVRLKSIPLDALGVREIEDSEIPLDREFRNAWKDNQNSIGFDLIKAKEIQLERIRKAREPKLQELDIEYMKALESNDSVKLKEISDQKEVLRNITQPLIDLEANSIDDIKNAFPEVLKNV